MNLGWLALLVALAGCSVRVAPVAPAPLALAPAPGVAATPPEPAASTPVGYTRSAPDDENSFVTGTYEGGEAATTPTPPATKARAARVAASKEWRCAWPRAAAKTEFDICTALVRVTVSALGKPETVEVMVESPTDLGVGEAARRCAMKQRFEPGVDEAEKPARSLTGPIRVRFER